ncbi:MAG: hypothetical protein COZ06_26520 [Armatimonadetes bacterium CG_4_10_14_3_um_filter_66_18]|nr:MAG: hypothetical protein COS65_05420 [Armatimonadetes bacterium CG06_land_8_20_14_3_00_66_21]PIW19805.1 MAG: hypothetical protein COW34_03390 [Armatimonadetes bacterium CG17_big_fil_post_rev_8_21_14_2_50_66_6]PIX46707.1 MAG: hypothetical protein COZ57_10565 [Armatimonadetes bacterium CG_4_8_14_3_um_filter_66_20]PIY41467.1 MAG: hypothetical protein COZ06_26520 [Armatimonadetes bacterium CG_4_10_14_3_um_filter_66_18]PIZ40855.1 MAG: hypothetical protein COY42_20365 [Armatimonadetes bacterium C
MRPALNLRTSAGVLGRWAGETKMQTEGPTMRASTDWFHELKCGVFCQRLAMPASSAEGGNCIPSSDGLYM